MKPIRLTGGLALLCTVAFMAVFLIATLAHGTLGQYANVMLSGFALGMALRLFVDAWSRRRGGAE